MGAPFRYRFWNRRTVPDFEVEIDYGHPLGNGLLFFALNYASGPIDLVGLARGAPLGTATPSTSPYGPTQNMGGGSYFWTPSNEIISATEISWATGFDALASTSSSYLRPFGRTANNGSSGPYANWDFEVNPGGAGANEVSFNYSDGSTLIAVGTWTGMSPQPTVLEGTVSGSLATGYGNGASVVSRSGNVYSNFATNSDIILAGSSAASVSNNYPTTIRWGAFWGLAHSADLAAWLNAESFAMLRPVHRAFYSIPASSGTNIFVSDVGSGSETFSGTASATVTDTSTGTDAIGSLLASLYLNDAGTAADAIPSVLVALTVTDSSAGADAVDITATVDVSDVATAADAINVLATTLKTVADSAHGTDAITATAHIIISDTSHGQESLVINALLALADSVHGVDVATASNLAVEITTITFTYSVASMAFTMAEPQMTFSFVQPQILYTWN